ncbi:MAG: hypothetical protein N2203_04495 [Bacteroidia bacterium]|nr:hypothetical protein [Bacteroidia bacterium]
MNENTDILKQQKQKILSLVKEKSVLKQDVFFNTIKNFGIFKSLSKNIINELKPTIDGIDKRISIQHFEVNQFAYRLKIAGDILEIFMHTNVFEIDKSSPLYKSPYIKQNPLNAYCGVIYVYNFMADSFKYNRLNDIGILIARIFINRENHFFIETKLPLATKYSNFSLEPLSENIIQEIINDLIIFALEFDLSIPPFDATREISVNQINEQTSWITMRTGKRLGFYTDSNNEDDFTFQL